MSSFKGQLYIHKNKVNGKCYVGQTTIEPKKRWGSKGWGYHKQEKFYNAIKLYGWNNFEHIILPTIYHTQDELNQAEIDIIQELNSIEKGYNCEIGGYNNQLTNEIKQKISKSLKGRYGKPISVYSLNGAFLGTYGTTREILEKFDLKSVGAITDVCKGNLTRHKDFVFKYYEQNDENISYNLPQKKYRTPINQYDLNNNLIKKWDSIMDAVRFYNMSNSGNISRAIKYNKTSKGYIWKYDEVT
jgi:group I intron endonuclease